METILLKRFNTLWILPIVPSSVGILAPALSLIVAPISIAENHPNPP